MVDSMIVWVFLLLAGTATAVPRDDCGTKCVGILYETWFNQLLPGLLVYPEPNPHVPSYRCWGEPALSQYKSSNYTVADIHAGLLSKAGIDFLVIDYSNSNIENPQLDSPLQGFLRLYSNRS